MKTLGELYKFLRKNPQWHNAVFEHSYTFLCDFEKLTLIHYPDGIARLLDVDSSYAKIGRTFNSSYCNYGRVIVAEVSEDGKEIWLEEVKE